MKFTQRTAQLGLALICMTVAPSAFAYLDPGTGSFVLQMVIAGALGAMFYIKTAWAGTKAYLSRLFGNQSETETDLQDSAASSQSAEEHTTKTE